MAAVGQQMSNVSNRGAAVSLEPEIEVCLGWLSQEGGVDTAVAGKLWDGTTWHRPVMNGSKAFTVEDTFFSMCNAGHIPEIYESLMDGDAFGLRQRLTVMFAKPMFNEDAADDIRQACRNLPVSTRKPEDFLTSLLFPLLM